MQTVQAPHTPVLAGTASRDGAVGRFGGVVFCALCLAIYVAVVALAAVA
jgi:hypothetical protein